MTVQSAADKKEEFEASQNKVKQQLQDDQRRLYEDSDPSKSSQLPPGFAQSLPDFQKHRNELFDKACKAAKEVFQEKNLQYNDAISETGVLGAAVELVGITARFKALVIKNSRHGRDTKKELLEIAKDSLVYSNILMQMISEENWDGD
jgi:hypothetical protein